MEGWTSGELDTLAYGASHGATPREIAEALGRTTDSVRRKASSVDIRLGHASARWTEAEERELVRMRSDGMTYEQIGGVIGRTGAAVQVHASAMRRRAKTEGQDGRMA